MSASYDVDFACYGAIIMFQDFEIMVHLALIYSHMLLVTCKKVY